MKFDLERILGLIYRDECSVSKSVEISQ